jgi:RNA polymerase sigma factor (sigma-70 family)
MSEYHRALLRIDLQAAYRDLTENQLAAIQLWAGGYTQEEIAVELGVSQQRVCQLLDAARTRLRQKLQ